MASHNAVTSSTDRNTNTLAKAGLGSSTKVAHKMHNLSVSLDDANLYVALLLRHERASYAERSNSQPRQKVTQNGFLLIFAYLNNRVFPHRRGFVT